jgi:hypothetical protein
MSRVFPTLLPLYLAIAFHAVYNLIVGVSAMPILREFAKRQEITQAVGA